jgi:hypothetical protein
MSSEEDQIDIIEELRNSPSQFAQTVINEIKALRDNNVLIRLDRDNWLKDYQKERDLADMLFDVIEMDETADGYIEKCSAAIVEYTKRRRP